MNQPAIDGTKVLALFIYGAILWLFGVVCGALAVFEWADRVLPSNRRPPAPAGGIRKS